MVHLGLLVLKVLLQVLEANLVSQLVLAVVLVVLLDGIVGEVDVEVLEVADIESLAGHPAVAFFEEIIIEPVVHEHPDADVEFAKVVEERRLEVFLQHDSAVAADIVDRKSDFLLVINLNSNQARLFYPRFFRDLFDQLCKGLQVLEELDALASIQVWRLEQPHVSTGIFESQEVLDELRDILLELGRVKVENESLRNEVAQVGLCLEAEGLKVLKELVFVGDGGVVLEMVDADLFGFELAQLKIVEVFVAGLPEEMNAT